MKIKIAMGIGIAGGNATEIITVDDSEWAEMSEDEQESYCRDVAFERFNWNWEIVS